MTAIYLQVVYEAEPTGHIRHVGVSEILRRVYTSEWIWITAFDICDVRPGEVENVGSILLATLRRRVRSVVDTQAIRLEVRRPLVKGWIRIRRTSSVDGYVVCRLCCPRRPERKEAEQRRHGEDADETHALEPVSPH
jgi:hypothetical protein